MSYLCIMENKQRICSKCKIEKELSSDNFCKDKYDKSGFTYQCKKCRAVKQKEWVKNNPETVKETNNRNKAKRKTFYSSPEGIICSRKAHLKRTYNITLEEFNNKLAEQDYKCAICKSNNTHDKHGVMAVDHNHETGQIRGLLCYKCNAGIGLLNDDKLLMKNAINYLEKYESLITH
jgi:hypothetical protein